MDDIPFMEVGDGSGQLEDNPFDLVDLGYLGGDALVDFILGDVLL